MSFNFITIFFAIFLLSSCSSQRTSYPMKLKKYKNDLVSVNVAVNLAMTSYIKGCVDKAKSFQQKNEEYDYLIWTMMKKMAPHILWGTCCFVANYY